MTPSKERALTALLTNRTKAEAAQAAGISPRTLRSYLADQEFMERYREAFNSLLEDATREAQQSISLALGVLREISTDPDAPAAVRVQASRGIIEYSLKLTEQIDTLRRMAELERAVLELEGGHK